MPMNHATMTGNNREMTSMILEQVRMEASAKLDQKRRGELGQFMTPSSIARFMADLFLPNPLNSAYLLDPGAGVGSLSAAFLDRCISGELRFNQVNITAYEIDDILREHLSQTFVDYSTRIHLNTQILSDDFIENAVEQIKAGNPQRFTHVILNPPYKKISGNSQHRLLLRQAGIETVNLYSAFLALSITLLAPDGQLVAIIPRSFCNGPYYRPFRKFLLERAVIRHIHLFESRSKAFKDDNVLQENIILALGRGNAQGNVTISTSNDDSFSDFSAHVYPFEQIVSSHDADCFIHVPSSPEANTVDISPAICNSLDDLDIRVSTGPVVDFRLKDQIRQVHELGDVPLLCPGHFIGLTTEWPKMGKKIPNAICHNANTEKWLYPIGFYCVVRRFSSKEERHRIMASVVEPETFPNTKMIGFENHLNVFHENKKGLPETLARGLAIFLNSTIVDKQFRRFNGHTQVNATDLRAMKYPSRLQLQKLGTKIQDKVMDQDMIDQLVGEL